MLNKLDPPFPFTLSFASKYIFPMGRRGSKTYARMLHGSAQEIRRQAGLAIDRCAYVCV